MRRRGGVILDSRFVDSRRNSPKSQAALLSVVFRTVSRPSPRGLSLMSSMPLPSSRRPCLGCALRAIDYRDGR